MSAIASVRFHIERRVGTGPRPILDDVWTRESIAGARSISAARRNRAELRRESPSYFGRNDWRIVKVTTTREVVK